MNWHPIETEAKRQFAHYLIGNLAIFIFIALVFWFGSEFGRILTIALFILAVLIGYLIALQIKHKGRFVLLQQIIRHVERPHEKELPGQPVFLFLIGAIITIGLFSNPLIALAGLIVVTYGDTVATIVGKYKGKIALVTNRTLEGTIAGIIVAAIPLMLVFPVPVAWSIAFIGMLAEYLPFNDNISIPIVAGITAMLLL